MSIKLTLVDRTEIIADDEYGLVDDTYEFNSSVSDYDKLKELSAKLTCENMKKVVLTDKDNNESIYKNMCSSDPKLYIVKEYASRIDIVIRLKQMTEQEQHMDIVKDAVQSFNDETALSVKSLYPEWEDLIGKTVKLGTKFNYWGFLYKTAQDNLLIQEQYKPGADGTESLYTYIDETHEGTHDDSIPYYGNQILEKGKFYTQDDVLYICTNGSGTAVFDRLEDLHAFVARYVEAEGTLEDPVPWYTGQILYKGKYYTENGIVYICNRDSEISVHGALKDLAAYVSVYVPEFPPELGTPENPIMYEKGIMLEEGKYYVEEGTIYKCIKSASETLEGKLADLNEYVEVYNPGGEGPEPPVGEEGTIQNPINFEHGTILYNGKYYKENGIIYHCFRDSGNEIYNDLKDLENIYVKRATTI